MICTTPGCTKQTLDGIRCPVCTMTNPRGTGLMGQPAITEPVPQRRHEDKAEFSGGNVDYYRVHIAEPKRAEVAPYTAECEDIIEALNMTFAEGSAFKAIWRSAAARTLGLKKKGQDEHGVYDAEKVSYYGQAMLRQRKRLTNKK